MNKRILLQRILGAAIAYTSAVIYLSLPVAWYWLPVSFLFYDTSMVGYLKNARVGAKIYNLGHGFIIPGGLLTLGYSMDNNLALMFIGSTWLFHIGVDRALGYGLKKSEGFKHTDLGDL